MHVDTVKPALTATSKTVTCHYGNKLISPCNTFFTSIPVQNDHPL